MVSTQASGFGIRGRIHSDGYFVDGRAEEKLAGEADFGGGPWAVILYWQMV